VSHPRFYRLTISTTWYDADTERARELEIHFKAALAGDVHAVRQSLTAWGLSTFRRELRRRGLSVPSRKIKARYEREETAPTADPDVTIETLEMEMVGKEWTGYRYPPRKVRYA